MDWSKSPPSLAHAAHTPPNPLRSQQSPGAAKQQSTAGLHTKL